MNVIVVEKYLILVSPRKIAKYVTIHCIHKTGVKMSVNNVANTHALIWIVVCSVKSVQTDHGVQNVGTNFIASIAKKNSNLKHKL